MVVSTGGGAFTVTAADPDFPPVLAVIVTLPVDTPVTTPVLDTVARPALLVVHVMTRPASGLPLASSGVALRVTFCPTTTVAVLGDTTTLATGTAVTVVDTEARDAVDGCRDLRVPRGHSGHDA
jgi:hypothetical protein